MKLLISITFIFLTLIQAYEIGRGLTLDEKLHVGGYFSTDYEVSKNKKLFRLDDVALIAYGSINEKLSYLLEYEAAPVYTKEFKSNTESNSLHFHRERLYLDYKHSDSINFRVGKQITPIGYWNLEPINVLRETSSNPLLSRQMFPKFLSGIDMYGYIPNFESLTYHIFAQKNKDLDEEYINIKNEHFFGLSIENEVDYNFQYGTSLGEFISNDNKRSRFIGLNIKYDMYPFCIKYETVWSTIKNKSTKTTDYKSASYIQSLYKINRQNTLVGRYEYFHDDALNSKQHIGILGYSYRPIYPVSIKGEFQYNSNSDLNKLLISFSVLF